MEVGKFYKTKRSTSSILPAPVRCRELNLFETVSGDTPRLSNRDIVGEATMEDMDKALDYARRLVIHLTRKKSGQVSRIAGYRSQLKAWKRELAGEGAA